MQFKKFIAISLIVILLFSCMSVSSFAQVTLINSNMTASTWSWADYGSSPALTYDSANDRNKFEMTASTPFSVRLTAIATDKVYLNHTYKIHFDIWGHFEDYEFSVILITKENLNTESSYYLTTINDNLASSDNSYTSVNLVFSPSYFVGSVTDIQIDFVFNRVNGATNVRNLYIKNLTMVDTDDNSGFFDGVFDWFSKVYYSIVGGTDSSGQNHTGLVQGIRLALESVKQSIVNAINGIQQWFINLGDDIGDFFTMLKNYLLYFRHPVTINSDGVPVDENGIPIYENIFDIPDFFEKLEEWVTDLEDAKTDVENGANQGVEKIRLTIAPLTSIISRVPFLTVFLTFALAVIVIKKVIG